MSLTKELCAQFSYVSSYVCSYVVPCCVCVVTCTAHKTMVHCNIKNKDQVQDSQGSNKELGAQKNWKNLKLIFHHCSFGFILGRLNLTGHCEGVFMGVGNFPRSGDHRIYSTGHYLCALRLVCVT